MLAHDAPLVGTRRRLHFCSSTVAQLCTRDLMKKRHEISKSQNSPVMEIRPRRSFYGNTTLHERFDEKVARNFRIPCVEWRPGGFVIDLAQLWHRDIRQIFGIEFRGSFGISDHVRVPIHCTLSPHTPPAKTPPATACKIYTAVFAPEKG